MNQPLVSVLSTVYNREHYLVQSLESVLRSTNQNFELIIIDDCSTDNSYAIAKEFSQKDSRIRLYRNKMNLGQFQNRNKAASYARGKYIKYLDSDDILYPHGLEVMVNSMEQFPKAAFGMSGPVNPPKPYPILMNHEERLIRHLLNGSIFIHGPSAIIFRKDIFEKTGYWGNNTYVGSDTEKLIRLSFKYDHVQIQPALIWWRQHDGQAIVEGRKNNEYLFLDVIRTKSIIKEAPINNRIRNAAYKKLRNLYLLKIFREACSLRLSNSITLLSVFFKEMILKSKNDIRKNCLEIKEDC